LEKEGLYGQVEIAGICCTAHDLSRYRSGSKVVGPLSRQLMFVKSGIADVAIIDQECVRADIVSEANKKGTRVIATSDQICAGLPDFTSTVPETTTGKLIRGDLMSVLVRDPAKVAQVAVKTAMAISAARRRQIISHDEEILAKAEKCSNCQECRRACPNDLEIGAAIHAARSDSLEALAKIYDYCMNCARCVSACPRGVPIIDLIEIAARGKIKNEKFKMRAGRGPIRDLEIRNVGRPIVMGEIPGVIAFAGCSNYPQGSRELAEMADEFARRRFIVVSSGCSAMDIARYRDADGQSLYEKYPGDFDAGCISNVGSCVANAHIIGAAIKIANIFAKKPLRANFEEIADYILNRVGAVAIAWGAQHQKAASIATGANRLGIPVILGPHGPKFRRAFLGRADKPDKWNAYNIRTGGTTYVGPAPEHLVYVAETKEEAIVVASRLVMRPSDTSKGRLIKLSNYLDLHRKFYGTLPEDFHLFVRTESDLPLAMKEELLAIMRERQWQPKEIPELGSTLVERLVPKRA
jgi:acetyl-CoA decarbonylase/synthase complex subunit alpha